MRQIEIMRSPAELALLWRDGSRADHERYLSALVEAKAQLTGRKDQAAAWARPQLEAEAKRVTSQLKRVDSCAGELEAAREAFRAAVAKTAAALAAVQAAADVDTLLRARAQLELDGRAEGAARTAFAEAAAKATLPGFTPTYPLNQARARSMTSGDNETLSGLGGIVAGLDRTGARNTAESHHADVQIHARGATPPAQLVWDIAGETTYRSEIKLSALAFDLRFEAFCQRHDIECEPVDLARSA